MITHVAVKLADGGKVWWLPWPCRHCHVLQAIFQCRGEKRDDGRDVQGFLVDGEREPWNARFVNRREGAAYAIECGQIKALRWPPDLYSEDLW